MVVQGIGSINHFFGKKRKYLLGSGVLIDNGFRRFTKKPALVAGFLSDIEVSETIYRVLYSD